MGIKGNGPSAHDVGLNDAIVVRWVVGSYISRSVRVRLICVLMISLLCKGLKWLMIESRLEQDQRLYIDEVKLNGKDKTIITCPKAMTMSSIDIY